MPTEGIKRRPTALFSSDVVCNSRLMGEDEESTQLVEENEYWIFRYYPKEYKGLL